MSLEQQPEMQIENNLSQIDASCLLLLALKVWSWGVAWQDVGGVWYMGWEGQKGS